MSILLAARRAPLAQLARRAQSPLPLRIPHAQLHASARAGAPESKIVTAYSFAAKPREGEEKGEQEGKESREAPREATREALRGRIDPDSDIGRWRALVLQGGDAGEDALIVGRSADSQRVVMSVADGVGGWTEQGIDPSMYSYVSLGRTL